MTVELSRRNLLRSAAILGVGGSIATLEKANESLDGYIETVDALEVREINSALERLYLPQEWRDNDPGTPISAARLHYIEYGIADVAQRLYHLEKRLGGEQ